MASFKSTALSAILLLLTAAAYGGDRLSNGRPSPSLPTTQPTTRPSFGSFAEAAAGVDANGNPIARARTSGPGSHAVADSNVDGVKGHAESHGGHNTPGKDNIADVGIGNVNADLEKFIRDSDIPAELKAQLLEQLKHAK